MHLASARGGELEERLVRQWDALTIVLQGADQRVSTSSKLERDVRQQDIAPTAAATKRHSKTTQRATARRAGVAAYKRLVKAGVETATTQRDASGGLRTRASESAVRAYYQDRPWRRGKQRTWRPPPPPPPPPRRTYQRPGNSAGRDKSHAQRAMAPK